jgi:hypothetical protein
LDAHQLNLKGQTNMMTPNKELQETPSWPQAQAAKDAWNAIRVTDASAEAKQAAGETFKAAMCVCLAEAGLIPAR